MIDYANYKAEELLVDDGFLNYCRTNDPVVAAIWESHLAIHPQMLEQVNIAKKLYHSLSITVAPGEKETALNKLKAAISNPASDREPVEKNKPIYHFKYVKKRFYVRFLAAAAIIGLLLAIGIWYTNNFRKGLPTGTDYSQAHFVETYNGALNKRTKVTLPDGSVVTLNYGSKITLDKDFNKKVRWLYLDGEAFFSVKRDENKPFTVITAKTATTALGTSFKVKNFSGEQESNVMLATGKVNVESLSRNKIVKNILLQPGEEIISTGNEDLSKSAFDLNLLDDWQHTKISFNNASMEDISRQLQFFYGVHLVIKNKPVKAVAFTGKFFENSLNEVLEAIAFTNKFKFTQTGNTVSIVF